jgi:hypothetical protein
MRTKKFLISKLAYTNTLFLTTYILLIFSKQSIPGVNHISEGYNPATWMLEVTTQACEEILGLDFAVVYKNSDQFR